MFKRTVLNRAVVALTVAGIAGLAVAQDKGGNPPNGSLHFQSNLGSFKFFNGNGTVSFKFKGTVLIRDFQGTPTATGNVKKEYDSHGRVAFFGDGQFNFTGHFASLQWFGTDVDGSWNGRGGFRVYGDYDKNMQTGWFWEGDDVAHRIAWPTQSQTYILPKPGGKSGSSLPQPVLKKKGS